jgi:integrase
MPIQLTDLAVKSMPFPQEGTATLWDGTLKGFGVRAGKSSKTFIVLIESGRRQKIGRYPLISLQEARGEAKRLLAEKTLGRVRPRFLAYPDARSEFLRHCEGENKASTVRGYRSRMNRVEWERTNLADIKPRDVLQKLKVYDDRPMEKRYVFVVLRTFFNWCVSQHYIDASPMDKLEPPAKNGSRERVLSHEEIQAVWNACPDDAYGTVVKLLILTGQRRGEPEYMTLEGDLVTIAGAYTKNHRTHSFPVGQRAQELLTKPRRWGGWGKSKENLDKASGVRDWTIHDLRRTFSTLHGEIGTPPHVVERLINHVTGTVSGVAAVYNRYQYLPEMREAMAKYERLIDDILAAS